MPKRFVVLGYILLEKRPFEQNNNFIYSQMFIGAVNFENILFRISNRFSHLP
jgi:hypothetical protein